MSYWPFSLNLPDHSGQHPLVPTQVTGAEEARQAILDAVSGVKVSRGMGQLLEFQCYRIAAETVHCCRGEARVASLLRLLTPYNKQSRSLRTKEGLR